MAEVEDKLFSVSPVAFNQFPLIHKLSLYRMLGLDFRDKKTQLLFVLLQLQTKHLKKSALELQSRKARWGEKNTETPLISLALKHLVQCSAVCGG